MTSTTGAAIEIYKPYTVALNTQYKCRHCNEEFESARKVQRHSTRCKGQGQPVTRAMIYVINPVDFTITGARQVPVGAWLKKRHTYSQLKVLR